MCELDGGIIPTTLPRKSMDSILRKEFEALSCFRQANRHYHHPWLYLVPLHVQPTEEQLLDAYTTSHSKTSRLDTTYRTMFGHNRLGYYVEVLVVPAKLMLDRSLDAIGLYSTPKVMAHVLIQHFGLQVDGDVAVGNYRNNTLISVSSVFCPVGGLSRLVQTPEQTAAVHEFATSLRTRIEKAEPAYAAH